MALGRKITQEGEIEKIVGQLFKPRKGRKRKRKRTGKGRVKMHKKTAVRVKNRKRKDSGTEPGETPQAYRWRSTSRFSFNSITTVSS